MALSPLLTKYRQIFCQRWLNCSEESLAARECVWSCLTKMPLCLFLYISFYVLCSCIIMCNSFVQIKYVLRIKAVFTYTRTQHMQRYIQKRQRAIFVKQHHTPSLAARLSSLQFNHNWQNIDRYFVKSGDSAIYSLILNY